MVLYSPADIYRQPSGGVRIPPRMRLDLVRIADRCGVDRLILFGSRAKGTAVATSDVDLAVVGGDYDAFLGAAESDVWSLLMLDVTCLDDTISKAFAEEIQNTGILLYDRRFYVRKLDNFQSCVEVLRTADFSLSSVDPIYRVGILEQFKLAFVQGWKALQQVMRDDGVQGSESGSPRELLQLGHRAGYLAEEETWLEMLRWHNVATLEYDEEKSGVLTVLIQSRFLPAMDRLSESLDKKVRERRRSLHAQAANDKEFGLVGVP